MISFRKYKSSEELEKALEEFVNRYNNKRYHESLKNLPPADVYFGRSEQILEKRRQIKSDSIRKRRQLYFQQKLLSL